MHFQNQIRRSDHYIVLALPFLLFYELAALCTNAGQRVLSCSRASEAIFLASLRHLYKSTIDYWTSRGGKGILTLHNSLQSNVSLTLPQELKRAYLSNSLRLNSKYKYSGINLLQSLQRKFS